MRTEGLNLIVGHNFLFLIVGSCAIIDAIYKLFLTSLCHWNNENSTSLSRVLSSFEYVWCSISNFFQETLKSSGIGRAVMMLFKHPRETRKNKESAGRLINKWSRPIFGLNDNFKSMSRGGDCCGDAASFSRLHANELFLTASILLVEREQRDLENMSQSKRRRLSSGKNESEPGSGAPEPGQLRPGGRGFVMRARVPKPSNKDYVIRPRWNVPSNDDDSERPVSKPSKSRKDERLEKHRRNFAERKKNLKMQRAVGISIEGNKMPLS